MKELLSMLSKEEVYSKGLVSKYYPISHCSGNPLGKYSADLILEYLTFGIVGGLDPAFSPVLEEEPLGTSVMITTVEIADKLGVDHRELLLNLPYLLREGYFGRAYCRGFYEGLPWYGFSRKKFDLDWFYPEGGSWSLVTDAQEDLLDGLRGRCSMGDLFVSGYRLDPDTFEVIGGLWVDDALLSALVTECAPMVIKPVEFEDAPRRTELYLFRWGKNYKIGYSLDPESRFRSIFCGLPKELYEGDAEIVARAVVRDYKEEERVLHETYKEFRCGGEWFSLGDSEVTEIRDYLQRIGV